MSEMVVSERVRISLDDSLQKLNELISAFNAAASSVKNLKNEITGVNSQKKTSIQSISNDLSTLSNRLKGTGDSFGLAILKANVFYAALSKVSSLIQSIPESGIDYLRNFEIQRLGMAGNITALTSLNGDALKLNQSLVLSDQLLKRLQIDAITTAASSSELINTFGGIQSAGLRANMSFPQIEEITTLGVIALKANKLDSSQYIQELRDLIAGGIDRSSALANIFNIKDADIKRAKTQVGGLYQFLIEKFSSYKEVSDEYVKTFNGGWENLTETLQLVSAEGFKPLFNYLTQLFPDITANLGEINTKTKEIKLNPIITEQFQALSNIIINIIELLKTAIGYILSFNQEIIAIGAGLIAFSAFNAVVGGLVGILARLFTALSEIGVAWKTLRLGAGAATTVISGIAMPLITITGLLVGAYYAWKNYNSEVKQSKTNLTDLKDALRNYTPGSPQQFNQVVEKKHQELRNEYANLEASRVKREEQLKNTQSVSGPVYRLPNGLIRNDPTNDPEYKRLVAEINKTQQKMKEVKHIELKALTIDIANKYGIDPRIPLALIVPESTFNPTAVNPKALYHEGKEEHATGLIQLRPSTANDFYYTDPITNEKRKPTTQDLLKPEISLDIAMQYMQQIQRMSGKQLSSEDWARAWVYGPNSEPFRKGYTRSDEIGYVEKTKNAFNQAGLDILKITDKFGLKNNSRGSYLDKINQSENKVVEVANRLESEFIAHFSGGLPWDEYIKTDFYKQAKDSGELQQFTDYAQSEINKAIKPVSNELLENNTKIENNKLEIQSNQNEISLKQLENRYNLERITSEDFYREKIDITRRINDEELSILENNLNLAKGKIYDSESERAAAISNIESQIVQKRAKNEQDISDIMANQEKDRLEIIEKNATNINKILLNQSQLNLQQVYDLNIQKGKIEQQDTIKGLTNDPQSLNVLSKNNEYEALTAVTDKLNERYSVFQDNLDNIKTKLNIEVKLGLKSTTDAEKELSQETISLSTSLKSKLSVELSNLFDKFQQYPDLLNLITRIFNDLNIKIVESTNNLGGPLKKGIDDFFGSIDAGTEISQGMGQIFSSMENSMLSFIKTGKMGWEELGNTILDVLLRVQMKLAESYLYDKFKPQSGENMWTTAINAGLSYFTGTNSNMNAGAKMFPTMSSFFGSDITSLAVPGNATGGLVGGIGTDRSDSNLMSVPKGSYVINARSVKKLGKQFLDNLSMVRLSKGEYVFSPEVVKNLGINALNNINNIASYATGGLVGGAGATNIGGSIKNNSSFNYTQNISIDAKNATTGVDAQISRAMKIAKDEAVAAVKNEFYRHGSISSLISR